MRDRCESLDLVLFLATTPSQLVSQLRQRVFDDAFTHFNRSSRMRDWKSILASALHQLDLTAGNSTCSYCTAGQELE